ncbi:MAG: 50S ribosomal protein L10 [Maricaulaceae bacterium]|jgi:large subunit ribosomal protein L10
MERAEKTAAVDALKGVFAGSGAVVVAHYSGLSVAEMTTLRGRMRDAGAQVKVVKNRLAKIALKGTPGEEASGMFTGPVAIAFSEDPVSAPKATVEFAKTNEKLIVIGGFMGETILDEGAVKNLASLPSLDELRGKLVGLLQAPAQKLAAVAQAPASQLARVINAYAQKEAS